MGILGETYIPLLTQDEVWRTVDGGEFVLDEMPSEHRAAVLNLLERIAPVLYAEWVNDLLLGASEPEVRAEFGLGDPDPLTGHYARSEVLAWLEAQPLVRRLRKLRRHECGWTPRLLDLLDQDEIWREDSGEVIPLALMGPVDRARVLRTLDEQAAALFAEWLVEATRAELAESGVVLDDDGDLQTGIDPHAWLAARLLVRHLRRVRRLTDKAAAKRGCLSERKELAPKAPPAFRGSSGGGAPGRVRLVGVVDPDYAARATAGGADRDPETVVAEILAGPEFQAGLDRLTAETGRPRAELERESRGALAEMVAVQTQLALEAVDRLAHFALRAYDIEVDSDSLEALLALNRRHALVFLPSHKSYLDPFILRGAIGAAGLPCNHILGGVNVSFWPMGPVLRRSGVVFIRRTIKDDAVYKLALRSYLGYLVERRYNLEWYLEGGRSRTGKLRPPRLGVLSYLVEAFRERGVDDVYLVPVSIAYDQLQEVAAMAAEEHGAEKKAESFAWMLRYIRSQGQRLGKAYVNFAEPISLRQVRTERKLATEKF